MWLIRGMYRTSVWGKVTPLRRRRQLAEGRRAKETIMAVDDGATVLLPGQGKTVAFSGDGVRFVYAEPHSTYSLVEWVAAPGAPARRSTSTGQPTKRSTSRKARSASRWATGLWS